MAPSGEDIDYDEEPDFSDDEDFVDDISDADLMPDLMCQKPKESDGVDSVIVVDGVPAVGADRLEKLKGVVRKIFSKFGKVINEHYPLDAEEKTKGYIFLEFTNHANAVEVNLVSSYYYVHVCVYMCTRSNSVLLVRHPFYLLGSLFLFIFSPGGESDS